MNDSGFELRVEIPADSRTPVDAREELSLQLREALTELGMRPTDVESEAAAPDGARAVDPATIGALLVKVGPGALMSVARGIRGWFARSSARRVELEVAGQRIRLDKASPEDQQRLIEEWVRAVQGASAAPET